MINQVARIKDIAAKAHVAPSTVSNVLNDSKYVSDEVKARVYQAVEDLTYRPNLLARSLKTRRTCTVGVIIPEFNLFFMEIVDAIERYLYEHGYTMVVCSTSENELKEKKYLDDLVQRFIDGLIFLGMGQNPDETLKDYPVPVVTVDRPVSDMVPSVTIENEAGGYAATRHLLERGARRIALITGSCKARTNALRRQGYRRALEEYGIPWDESMEREYEHVNCEVGWQAAQELFSSGMKIDGVFCDNDFFAVGAMRYLLGKGIRVPQEVKVAGFDGIQISEMIVPGITTMVQPKRLMGEQAARILLRLIDGEILTDEEKYIQLEAKLEIREST